MKTNAYLTGAVTSSPGCWIWNKAAIVETLSSKLQRRTEVVRYSPGSVINHFERERERRKTGVRVPSSLISAYIWSSFVVLNRPGLLREAMTMRDFVQRARYSSERIVIHSDKVLRTRLWGPLIDEGPGVLSIEYIIESTKDRRLPINCGGVSDKMLPEAPESGSIVCVTNSFTDGWERKLACSWCYTIH